MADPVLDRYKQVVDQVVPAVKPVSPSLAGMAPNDLAVVARQAVTGKTAENQILDSAKQAVAKHVALRTPLTQQHAEQLFAAAFSDAKSRTGKPTGDAATAEEAAEDVGKEVQTAALGVSIDTELSDPVMLGTRTRRAAMILTFVGLGGSIGGQIGLGLRDKTKVSEWSFIGLMLTAFFVIIAILVLVMGYKNVKIKASGSPASVGGEKKT